MSKSLLLSLALALGAFPAFAQSTNSPSTTVTVTGDLIMLQPTDMGGWASADPSSGGSGYSGGGGVGGGGGGGDYITILYSDENGGVSIPGGYAEGCAPQTLNVSVSHTKQTSWTFGATYIVTAGYGVSESITLAASSSYPVPTGKCGFLKATEVLTVSGYDLYLNGEYAGSGIIVFLKGIKFNNGTL